MHNGRWLGSAVEGDMAAYLVVEHTILDPSKFEEYRTKVGPMIEKHGGRYITKGSGHKLLEVSGIRQTGWSLLNFRAWNR